MEVADLEQCVIICSFVNGAGIYEEKECDNMF